MKKKILSLILSFSGFCAYAQPGKYVFSIYNAPYTPLSGGTAITVPGWDEFDAAVPLGFNFNFLGLTTNMLYFDQNLGSGGDVSMKLFPNNTNLFSFGADLIDRGTDSLAAPSVISFKTDVVSAKKITKIEWNNVGFFGEYAYNGTLNDSANFQLWVYEDNNTLEVHWGTSGIQSDFLDIFDFGLPNFGMVENINIAAQNFDWLYYVSSTSPTPTVDSMDFNDFENLSGPIGLAAMPTSGTVFKFEKPVTQGVNMVALNSYTLVYPTNPSSFCTVEISKPGFSGDISLLDMNGKMILHQDARTGKNNLEMNELTSGTYVVNIRNHEASVFYKIIKQ